jgi:hypothetical protein
MTETTRDLSANPGVGYYIWSVIYKLDRKSRELSSVPKDIFSRIVLSQTVPRICAYLIIFCEDEKNKNDENKKKKSFPKRTSVVLDSIDTTSPSLSPIRCNMCLPLTDLPYTRVFEAIPPSAIISIFAAILCDAKVVVLSRHTWRLNDVLEVVLSLTYPLHMMTSLPVYQPILHFDDWKIMSSSPYNFVFGALVEDHVPGNARRLSRWSEHDVPTREFCDTYPSTIIVDLDVHDVDAMDTHLAMEFEKANVPVLPLKYRKRLIRAFDAAYVTSLFLSSLCDDAMSLCVYACFYLKKPFPKTNFHLQMKKKKTKTFQKPTQILMAHTQTLIPKLIDNKFFV